MANGHGEEMSVVFLANGRISKQSAARSANFGTSGPHVYNELRLQYPSGCSPNIAFTSDSFQQLPGRLRGVAILVGVSRL